MKSQETISIVIRVRNAAEDLRRCLTGIVNQVLPKGSRLEIIVVDNESSDESAAAAREFGAVVVTITAREFSWGRSLNMGIVKATGEIVLILSADAYPVEENWILHMIEPFSDPAMAGVYGRQVPRPDAPIDEIVRLTKNFGPTSQVIMTLPADFTPRGGNFPISNACAAIRRSVWLSHPFNEQIDGGEEGIWSYDVLSKGFSIVYQAEACVYHSHNDTVFRSAWRNLELIKKNVELGKRRLGPYIYMRYILSKVKRRLTNCFYPRLRFVTRIKGFVVLPFEVMAFMAAALLFHNSKNTVRYRMFFWNH